MSAPDQSVTVTAAEPTDADTEAAFASIAWFDWKAPRDLIQQYAGMHVAILGEEIIDADRDFTELARRLDARGDTIPMTRLVVKYVYTDEDDEQLGSRAAAWPG